MALIMNNDPEIKRISEQINNNKTEKEIADAKIKTLAEELNLLRQQTAEKEQAIINSKNTLQLCTQNISSLTAKLTTRQMQLKQKAQAVINNIVTKINNLLRVDPPGHPLSCQFLDSENAFQILYSEHGKDVKIIGDIRQDATGQFNIHKVSDCGTNYSATAYYMQKINLIFNQIKSNF